jgi:hypothetical protein
MQLKDAYHKLSRIGQVAKDNLARGGFPHVSEHIDGALLTVTARDRGFLYTYAGQDVDYLEAIKVVKRS